MSKLVTPFGFESTTSDVLRGVDLSGKTALVTGANSGIGHETARALASVGAAVVVAARRDRAGSDAATQRHSSPYRPATHTSRTSCWTWRTWSRSRVPPLAGAARCTSWSTTPASWPSRS